MPEWTNSQDAQGAAPSPPKTLASWYAPGLSDGLGDRLLMFDNSDAPSLELLRFRQDLAQIPGFESALREQVQRLDRFRHPAFARVRSVQRLEPDDDLALISNYTPGKRLSEVLHRARGPEFAAALIRQLAPALALLQRNNAGNSHGLLNPDRIIVSPEGRLTIVEHVVGPAIDSLNLRAPQLSSLGIDLPTAPGATPRLDASTDWYQLGLVAVSVLLGRPVTESDLPQLDTLLDRLGDEAGPDGTPLSPFIREWLGRALQVSGERIESDADAQEALDELLREEQPRGSRRLESRRPEPEATAPRSRVDEVVDTAVDLTEPAVVTPAPAVTVTEEPPVRPVASPAPRPSPAPAPAPVRPPRERTPAFERPAPAETRQPMPPVPVWSDQARSAFELEALAGRKRVLDLENRATLRDPDAATGTAGRGRFSTSVVAALALIVVVEAGAITWLGRALWLTPQPPVIAETDASGESVAVSGRSTGPAPLRLAVAPDLGWVRVTSLPSDGILGQTPAASTTGTIRISSPIALRVLEGSRVLGSVPGADLKVQPGRHELELVNVPLGYRSRQSLEVEAGQTVSVHVAPPHGWVTIDASPWAEVSIDGRPAGRTPLGPLPLALGEYDVTFKHPAGSSDRQRVTVKSDATLRVIGKLRF